MARSCVCARLVLITLLVGCAWGTPKDLGHRFRGLLTHGDVSLQATRELQASQDASTECPSWVDEYVKFHKANKGKEETKYMVFYCLRKAGGKCPGLGDRFRGIEFAAKVAIATNRVLLIYWDTPASLETFVQPADIDWTLPKTLGIDMEQIRQAHTVSGYGVDVDKATGKYKDLYYEETVLGMSTNHFDEGNELPGPTFTLVSKPSSCLFNALFKPSDALIAKTAEVREQLLGKGVGDRQYVAVHLRMGHLDGEMYDVNRGWDRFKGLLGILRCAQRYGQGASNRPGATTATSPSHATHHRSLMASHTQGDMAATDSHILHSLPRATDASGSFPLMGSLEQAAEGAAGLDDNVWAGRVLESVRAHRQQQEQQQRSLLGRSKPVSAAGDAGAAAGGGAVGTAKGASQGYSNSDWDFDPPVLLLTDDVVLRGLIADGAFKGFVGPAYVAHHLQRSSATASVDEHLMTFVDLLLLARARCMIHSASGFSKAATVWGWPDCQDDVKVCLNRYYNHVTGEAIKEDRTKDVADKESRLHQ